jgi:Small-conductance mechanosensitive channel
VILERVTRPNGAPIWLFSEATLESVPALYDEVTLGFGEGDVPRFLTRTRVLGIRVFEWIAVLLGLPLIYLLTILLNWVLRPVIRALWRRVARQSDLFERDVLPGPVRLLILVVAIRWLLSALPLPLLVRQFWSNLATVLTVVGVVWLLYFLSAETERFVRRRFPRANTAAAATLLRNASAARRSPGDLLGVLILLRHYGIDPTPALAGLGVGGIAIALAAQKTLENVIAGASLIFDQAVRVGDFLKMGDVQGTVDKVGLRSTRIRTLDRTIVSVPNSQIANVSLETLGARQVLVPPHRRSALRDDDATAARGGRWHPPPPRRAFVGRTRVGARAIPAARCVLARRRCLRLRDREGLDPLPRNPGAAPLRGDGHRRKGRNRNRVPVPDDVCDQHEWRGHAAAAIGAIRSRRLGRRWLVERLDLREDGIHDPIASRRFKRKGRGTFDAGALVQGVAQQHSSTVQAGLRGFLGDVETFSGLGVLMPSTARITNTVR